MKILGLAACLITGAIIVGCAQQPPVLSEVQKPQRKILTATQWKSLADRVVANVLCEPGKPEVVKSTFQSGKPLYIADAAPDMPFSSTFKMYLTQSLLERGVRVSKTPANSDVLRFEVRRFLYDHNKGLEYPYDTATFWTTLGALGWAAGTNDWSTQAGIAAVAVSGPVLDFLNGMGNTTDAEVIVTAYVENDRTIPFIYTEPFYVEPSDLRLYWTNFPTVPMGENGPMVAGPPRARTIRAVSR